MAVLTLSRSLIRLCVAAVPGHCAKALLTAATPSYTLSRRLLGEMPLVAQPGVLAHEIADWTLLCSVPPPNAALSAFALTTQRDDQRERQS